MDLPDSPLSLWLAEYGDYQPAPELAGDVGVDVAVIGGGYLGMATAIALRRRSPAPGVAVLEAKTIGYGASGRNGSFAMTVIGLGFGTTALLRGREFVRRSHVYMERCVDRLEAFIDDAGLDCAKIRPGFLRVATTPAYVRRLQKQVALMSSLGFEGIDWIGADATRKMVNSARYLGAMWEPRLLLVDPARLVREEKRHAITLGADVYENSPVLAVVTLPKRGGYRLLTPHGSVTAARLVYATNAYSHLFGERHLERHLHWLWPHLSGVAITHRWGGPFSVTMDLTPALGYLGTDRTAVYGLGCIGHGVAMSYLNGEVLADLLTGDGKGESTRMCPFVNRRVIRWPPEPAATAAKYAIRGYLQAEDAFCERVPARARGHNRRA